jgi:prepilin-type N-terminal cleavage/methylation domain-containing protein
VSTRNPRRPARPAAIHSSQGGFSLIEMMIALVILAVGAMAVAGGMAVAISSDTGAGEQTRAMALASRKLEELKAQPYASLASEPARAVDATGKEGSGPYTRQVTVVEGAEGPNTKSVTVSVDYRTGRNNAKVPRKVQLYTVIYSGS